MELPESIPWSNNALFIDALANVLSKRSRKENGTTPSVTEAIRFVAKVSGGDDANARAVAKIGAGLLDRRLPADTPLTLPSTQEIDALIETLAGTFPNDQRKSDLAEAGGAWRKARRKETMRHLLKIFFWVSLASGLTTEIKIMRDLPYFSEMQNRHRTSQPVGSNDAIPFSPEMIEAKRKMLQNFLITLASFGLAAAGYRLRSKIGNDAPRKESDAQRQYENIIEVAFDEVEKSIAANAAMSNGLARS